MTTFASTQNRDAWGTIRGYVYQVDLTILRWLGLQPGQVLELERGEDIDVVSNALLQTGQDVPERLLEQIKHREANLTLRSPEAVGAIARFLEHRDTNPDTDLLFRYATNAHAGREVRSPIPGGMPAIEAWQQLRDHAPDDENHLALLAGIRELLQSANKPNDLSNDIWARYEEFVTQADDEELLALIGRFEWSTANPEAEAQEDITRETLLAQGHAASAEQAKGQYHALFVHTIRVLAQPGPTRLTPDERDTILAAPSLDAAGRAILDRLDELCQRVARLEQAQLELTQRQDVLESSQAMLGGEFERLRNELDVDAPVVYGAMTQSLDVPPLVHKHSRRHETVAGLTAEMEAHTWVAMHAGAGEGKTQLAVLTTQALDSCSGWIRMRDLNAQQASASLDAACKAILGDEHLAYTDIGELYDCLAEHVGEGGLLVIDDIPRYVSGDLLSERLIRLALAFRSSGARLLSTSHHPAPRQVHEMLGAQLLTSVVAPAFTDEEIVELLQVYGAPEALWVDSVVRLVRALAHDNATLLSAVADHLRQTRWDLDGEAFKELLIDRPFADDIENEAISRLTATVDDEASRELLWRLCLPVIDFSLEEARELASVDPPIGRPREKLLALEGIWLQESSQGCFAVSPVIRPVGESELSAATKRACHLALAERTLAKGVLNQLDAQSAIMHFSAADEFDRAGVILITALDSLRTADRSADDYGLLLSHWTSSETPLPREMSLELRIHLRALQIQVRHARGRDVSFAVSDLRELIPQASSSEAWGVLGVPVLAVLAVAEYDLAAAHDLMRRSMAVLSDGVLPDGSTPALPGDLHVEGLVWVTAPHMHSAQDVSDWLDMVEALTPEQRQRAMSGQLADQGAPLVADCVWTSEAEKTEEERNWRQILGELSKLTQRARELNMELLWACFVSAQIVVHAAHCDDLAAAAAIAEEALAEASDDTRVRFLISECVGRQHAIRAEPEQAIEWLEKALRQATEAYAWLRIDALLRLAVFIGPDDAAAGVEHVQQAVELARRSGAGYEHHLVKALAELAIARWLADDMMGAFDALDEGAECLLDCKTDADHWKGLFVWFGHACGYLAAMASLGKPPKSTIVGGACTHPTRERQHSWQEARCPLLS